MQIQLASSFEKSVVGREAEAIIRKCVHCGFCLATCPTYQVLGDELDSPRGRIYLMKQFYEGQSPTKITQLHLDRCLTCRSCESTCPSGVQYGHLLEITKPLIEHSVPRKITSQWWRKALSFGLTSKSFPVLIKLAKLANYLRMLPKNLANKLPKATPLIYRVDHPKLWGSKSVSDSSRAFSQSHGAVLLLEGCVQNALAPNIQKASIKILEGMNFHIISLPHEKCCGALPLHLGEKDKTLAYMRYNIDLWWPYIENGVLALVSNISGCGVMVKDYGTWLKNDPKYAEKSRIVSSLCLDISQFITQHFDKLNIQGSYKELHTGKKIVFQTPCTLQHGQKLPNIMEQFWKKLEIQVVDNITEKHLCCGSAGTYSIFQPDIAEQLRDRKLRHLNAHQPELILSANIGCIQHLQSATQIPVLHWIEYLAQLTENAN